MEEKEKKAWLKGIEKAISYLDSNKWDKQNNSSKYDFVHNSKKYPPKLVIRYATDYISDKHPEIHIPTLAGGEPINNFLRQFGFTVRKKDEMDVRSELITRYKEHVRNYRLEGEIYKWELLTQYNGRPELNAPDFYNEIKSINFKNLIYPVGITVVHHLAKEQTEPYRDCFKVLFDENLGLEQRLKHFNEKTLKLYKEIAPKVKLSHHQDERTMATFLTYHNPDKYAFYKDSFYQKYCKLIGVEAMKAGMKYLHYLQLIEELISDYINDDQELLDLVYGIIPSAYYQDTNHKILAQDILYQTLDKMPKMNGVVALMASDSTGWQDEHIGKLKDYDASIIWNSKRPSGTDETIAFLRNIIEEGNTFNLYYSSRGFANYRATIIDFAEDKDELNEKNWNSGTLHYQQEFDDYKDGNKHAAIVFLVKSLEKINPIPLTDFKFYKNHKPPTQDNLSPITHEPEILEIDSNPTEQKNESNMDEVNFPLNQILFGPPGTGKTFNTVNKSLEIIGEKIHGKSRKEIKNLFDAKIKEGQIVFTTFHQSMSYEDFIEGIKPIRPLPNDQFVKYDIQPGIFYKICESAKSNYENAKSENNRKLSFEEAFEKFREDWEEDPNMQFPLKTEGYDFTILGFTNTSIQFKKASGGTSHTLSIGTLKELYYGKEYNFKQGVGIYYPSVLKKVLSYQNERPNEVIEMNYVIIIDEINRGNVSQIFGELITLIEEDKRLGKEEALEAILPYSKEKFGVPPNLCIIGTMNTADRSVEALDAALRRRFSFEEISPKPQLISTEGMLKAEKGFLGSIELPFVLETINNRIEKLLDKDHLIGHSYFMPVSNLSELKVAFQSKIIPLLQEYFFGDYGKIGLVLGKGFFEPIEPVLQNIFADFNDYDASGFSERTIY